MGLHGIGGLLTLGRPGTRRGGGSITYLLRDEFNDMDGTLLQNHTPDLAPEAAAWAAYSGTITITGNRAVASTGGNHVYHIESGESNLLIKGTMRVTAAGYAGVFLRATDANNYIQCLVRYVNSKFYLNIIKKGSAETTVESGAVPLALDTDYDFTVTANEEEITFAVDDYQLTTSTVHQLSATRVGLWMNYGAIDRLTVEALAQQSFVRLANIPADHGQHGCEALGDLLYVVYGELASNKCHAYDPATGLWATKAELPIGIQSGITRAVNGKLYVIGGYNPSTQTYYNTVYEYDPAGDAWTQKADMPTGREDMGSAVLNGKIHVFGGLKGGSGDRTTAHEVYDPATNTWDTLAPLPDYKLLGDFGAACGGKIYAIGATNVFAGYPNLTPTADSYVYDPGTDTWDTIADCPEPRCYCEVEAVGNLLILGPGTKTTNESSDAPTLWAYDTVADTWTSLFDAPHPAIDGVGLAYVDGKLYMTGEGTYCYRINLPE